MFSECVEGFHNGEEQAPAFVAREVEHPTQKFIDDLVEMLLLG